MATQRYISTSFWTDKWIRSLDHVERYLYLYLMTNPETSIAGIYQITLDRMAFDTGIDERTLRPMLDRFAKSGKAYFYKEEWIILPSWPRHQRFSERSKIRTGIDRALTELPEDVWQEVNRVGYQYSYIEELKRPLKGYQSPSKAIKDLELLDTDTDTDTDINYTPPSAPATQDEPSRALTPMKDDLADHYQTILTSVFPASGWGNFGKERKMLQTLAKNTKALMRDTPYENEKELANAIFKTFGELRKYGKGEYWQKAPVTPSGLVTRWAQVVTALAEDYSRERDYTFEEVIF